MIPTNPPIKERRTASCPLPANNNSCPGRTERKFSSSGAPRKMEGINEINILEVVMAVIKIIKGREKEDRKNGERRRTKAAIRLTWIPGIKPVRIPIKIPEKKARRMYTNNGSINICK